MENFKKLFPLKKLNHVMKKRKTEKYFVKQINSERYLKSAIPAMQRALNKEDLILKSVWIILYQRTLFIITLSL